MNRRRFLSLAGTSIAGIALVGCGSKEANPEVVVTKIPNVAGAPPTLAPNATPPNTSGQAAGGAAPAPGGGASTFTLEAHDPYDWSTKQFTIAQGGTVTVKNTGALPHDFSVDALKITQPLDPGKSYEVKIPADAKPGKYEYYCNVPGHKEAGMVGTMTVVAKGGGGQAQQGGGQAGGAATFNLEAHDPYNWSTKKFTIAQGGTVTVKNTGALPHDFSVDALKIAQPLDPGKTYEIKIPADAKPGDYQYYCNVPGHKEAGMVGTMTVVAKGGGGAAAQAPAQQGAASPGASPAQTQPAAPAPQASPAASPASQGGAQTGATSVTVEMGDIFFKPKAFTIPANTDVTITLKNVGALPHDFNIDSLNLHSPVIQPKTTGTVKIKAPAGSYQYYCNQPGHKAAGMVGMLTVSGAAPAAPAASPAPATPSASPIASPAGQGGGQTAAAVGSSNVTIEMGDLFFKPKTFQIPANVEVTVTLKNTGALPHDFNVDQLQVKSAVIQPGQTGTVKVKGPKGTYQYYCNEPGHKAAGMVGTLTILESQ